MPPRDRSKLPDSCDEPFVLKGDLNTSKLTAAIAKKISGLRKVGITYSFFISLRNYPQNFWSAYRPAPVGLFFCHEHAPTYEFYGLPFSHALLSRGVAYPFHE